MDKDGFDRHPRKNIVPVRDVHKIDGLMLEDIPEVAPGYSPGYVIVVRDFDTMLMRKREGITEDEIYQIAKELALKRGVKLPD